MSQPFELQECLSPGQKRGPCPSILYCCCYRSDDPITPSKAVFGRRSTPLTLIPRTSDRRNLPLPPSGRIGLESSDKTGSHPNLHAPIPPQPHALSLSGKDPSAVYSSGRLYSLAACSSHPNHNLVARPLAAFPRQESSTNIHRPSSELSGKDSSLDVRRRHLAELI